MKKQINRYIIRAINEALCRELNQDERNMIYKISHLLNEDIIEKLDDEVETLVMLLKEDNK